MNTTPNSRDLEILQHVALHGLTTRAFLQQLFFAGATDSAVAKVVQRHVQNKWLRECKMGNGFSYIVLGRKSAAFVSGGDFAPRRFTEQSFPLAYGYLAFCTAHSLRRLASRDFSGDYPELCRPGMQTGKYFIDSRREPFRLATVILDRGNPPRNILRKLDRAARKRYAIPAFADLIQNGLFSITILTAWPLKQEYLQDAVRQSFRSMVVVDVATVPELQPFYRRI